MLAIMPGTGINDNLADKAKKLGIPVWRAGGASNREQEL
jgi:soluble P-type ATPase